MFKEKNAYFTIAMPKTLLFGRYSSVHCGHFPYFVVSFVRCLNRPMLVNFWFLVELLGLGLEFFVKWKTFWC
jgi:hypothetical protein